MDQFFALPPVSRTLGLSLVVLSLAGFKGWISYYNLAFLPEKVFPQAWRLVTPFVTLFAKKLLNIVFGAYFYYNNSARAESSFKSSAHYVVFLAFCGLIIQICVWLGVRDYFLTNPLILAMAYYFSMTQPAGARVNLYFIQIPVRYYPLGVLGLEYLQTESLDHLYVCLFGIIAGHLYLFINDIYPMYSNKPSIFETTPQWLNRVFEHPYFSEQAPVINTEPTQQEKSWGGATGARMEDAAQAVNWRQRGKGRRLVD